MCVAGGRGGERKGGEGVVADFAPLQYAHKADILRLEALRDYGGTYLDIDTFVLRPFTRLYDYDAVLGMEAAGGEVDDMKPNGLCNAIIIARQNATFISRWLASYDTFDENKWADHSVVSASCLLACCM